MDNIRDLVKNVLNNIETLNEHHKIATSQRNAYNYQKLNIGTGCLFIELDWKQKILIGFKKWQITNKILLLPLFLFTRHEPKANK